MLDDRECALLASQRQGMERDLSEKGSQSERHAGKREPPRSAVAVDRLHTCLPFRQGKRVQM